MLMMTTYNIVQICDGDLITVGSRHSPYIYQFRWSSSGEQVHR
jgi:hypothetical protein